MIQVLQFCQNNTPYVPAALGIVNVKIGRAPCRDREAYPGDAASLLGDAFRLTQSHWLPCPFCAVVAGVLPPAIVIGALQPFSVIVGAPPVCTVTVGPVMIQVLQFCQNKTPYVPAALGIVNV